MRIISLKSLKAFWSRYPQAERPLRLWYKTALAAKWRNFMEVRASFRTADIVKVNSGNRVVIFDIGGNKYRLITAIHYDVGCLYTLMVLTHSEYDRTPWKENL